MEGVLGREPVLVPLAGLDEDADSGARVGREGVAHLALERATVGLGDGREIGAK